MTIRKKVVAITIDPELHEWLQHYIHHDTRRTKSVSGIISEFVLDLSSSVARNAQSTLVINK